MNETTISKLFNLADIGFALLNESGEVFYSNKVFQKYCLNKSSILYDCFPETIGLENVLKKIARGEQKSFKIENINRYSSSKKITYLNLSLHHYSDNKTPVVCYIKDVTEQALLKQQSVQQKNKIQLLKYKLIAKDASSESALFGQSAKMQSLRDTAFKLARAPNVNILLTGESGTGKNLLAREIHSLSANSKKPIIEINCAAIPDHLLESELFGFEKGAFTNALVSKKGLLEEANEGTLFLDEIAELSLALQAKLLHIIETQRFRRLGSTMEQQVEFRLITATNKNLNQLVAKKKFREDLLFRLNVVQLQLPPLRELDKDIHLLAQHFVEIFNIKFNKKVIGLSANAKQALLDYSWPGNVRELSNLIERAMIFIDDSHIRTKDLAFQVNQDISTDEWQIPSGGLKLEEIEKKLLQSALAKTDGNKVQAAKLLGLTRDTLRYRLEKYKL